MSSIRVLINEEGAPTMRYADASLLPSVGGDDRFSWRTPVHWRDEPVHPLIQAARHPDGDGLAPQALLGDMRWVSSEQHPCVQVADVAAWVLRRVTAHPGEQASASLFELLKPLHAGEGGRTFDFFSIAALSEDQRAMYAHLQEGVEPPWWLESVERGRARV